MYEVWETGSLFTATRQITISLFQISLSYYYLMLSIITRVGYVLLRIQR